MWTRSDIEVLISGGETDHPILTLEVVTPAGTLKIMMEPVLLGRSMLLTGLHIQGEDVGPNAFGVRGLRRLAELAAEALDVDEIIVEGEVRTTGAGPGHRPGRLRFARKLRPER